MKKFRIVCLKCQKSDFKHHTILYVDWQERMYTVLCEDCGDSECYDQYGEQIKTKNKKEGEIIN